MSGLANNNQQQARLRQRKNLKLARYDSDLLAIMKTAQGRRFIWRVVDDTSGCLSVEHHADSYRQGVHNGKRDVGFRLWREAQRVAPEESILMFQEALKQQAEDELLRKDAERAAKEADEGGEP